MALAYFCTVVAGTESPTPADMEEGAFPYYKALSVKKHSALNQQVIKAPLPRLKDSKLDEPSLVRAQ